MAEFWNTENALSRKNEPVHVDVVWARTENRGCQYSRNENQDHTQYRFRPVA